jgi:hypothetical protein
LSGGRAISSAALSLVEPNSYVVFWNWGSALSTQAMWITQLLRYLSLSLLVVMTRRS